jgi:hypothetical protein
MASINLLNPRQSRKIMDSLFCCNARFHSSKSEKTNTERQEEQDGIVISISFSKIDETVLL